MKDKTEEELVEQIADLYINHAEFFRAPYVKGHGKFPYKEYYPFNEWINSQTGVRNILRGFNILLESVIKDSLEATNLNDHDKRERYNKMLFEYQKISSNLTKDSKITTLSQNVTVEIQNDVADNNDEDYQTIPIVASDSQSETDAKISSSDDKSGLDYLKSILAYDIKIDKEKTSALKELTKIDYSSETLSIAKYLWLNLEKLTKGIGDWYNNKRQLTLFHNIEFVNNLVNERSKSGSITESMTEKLNDLDFRLPPDEFKRDVEIILDSTLDENSTFRA
ncbi:MAG: hypothetical protein H0U71_08150 [Gammaproteobacteria bacterium]|nr:hypothetical protein [Gammaproteobacteria bacterium]